MKTNDLIKKLNRYSFEEKAVLCLRTSLDSIDFSEDYRNGKKGIPFPWLVDGFATLCILSNPKTGFHKDIFVDGIKDRNKVINTLFKQVPPNWQYLKGDVSYMTNPLLNPQLMYQRDADMILYRYRYLFSFFEDEFNALTNNVGFDEFLFVARLFSSYKELAKGGVDVFSFTRNLLCLIPEIIEPLSISRDRLVEETKQILDDLNDLSKFAYSFKIISSYPFISYNGNWYLFGFHNILNSITTGFMNRLTFSNKELSERLGIALEKYLFKIIDESGLAGAVEDDSILYKIGKQEYRKPDVSFEQNGVLVIIESKKAWSILKSAYNDEDAVSKEIEKGVEAVKKSIKSYIRFVEGNYTICGNYYSAFREVYLIICVENDNYWPKETILNRIKECKEFAEYSDFIDNNLIITSLYNLESYFLFERPIAPELLRDKPVCERNSLLKNSGDDLKRSPLFQEFIDQEEKRFESFKRELNEKEHFKNSEKAKEFQ